MHFTKVDTSLFVIRKPAMVVRKSTISDPPSLQMLHLNLMIFFSFLLIAVFVPENNTRGPWATLLTWENSLNHYIIEEDFLISSMYFHYFVIISPWKKGRALHLNKLESPSAKDALCQVWLKLAQWFWRRRWNVKSLERRQRRQRRQRRTTNKFWSEKLTWAFGSGELKRRMRIIFS